MQQKLVSILLQPNAYQIQEHLNNYLSVGWRIKDFKTLDGSALGGETAKPLEAKWYGWVIVLLEWQPPDGNVIPLNPEEQKK